MLDIAQLQLGFWKWNSRLLTDRSHLCVGKHVYGVNMLSVLLKTWRYRSWCEHVQCSVQRCRGIEAGVNMLMVLLKT